MAAIIIEKQRLEINTLEIFKGVQGHIKVTKTVMLYYESTIP